MDILAYTFRAVMIVFVAFLVGFAIPHILATDEQNQQVMVHLDEIKETIARGEEPPTVNSSYDPKEGLKKYREKRDTLRNSYQYTIVSMLAIVLLVLLVYLRRWYFEAALMLVATCYFVFIY